MSNIIWHQLDAEDETTWPPEGLLVLLHGPEVISKDFTTGKLTRKKVSLIHSKCGNEAYAKDGCFEQNNNCGDCYKNNFGLEDIGFWALIPGVPDKIVKHPTLNDVL